jgi:hypothetical protein
VSVRCGVRHPEPSQVGSRQKNGDQNGDQFGPSGRLRRCRLAPGTRQHRRPAPLCRFLGPRIGSSQLKGSERLGGILRLAVPARLHVAPGPARRWGSSVGLLMRTRLRRPYTATAGLRPPALGGARDERWCPSRLERITAEGACARSTGGAGGRSVASQRGWRRLRGSSSCSTASSRTLRSAIRSARSLAGRCFARRSFVCWR